MRNVPLQIIVHHSADISPKDQFDKVNEVHKERGFTKSSLGLFVGYHYFIEKTGQIRKAREEWEIGCHDAGENFNSLGICLAGNFDIEFPTNYQERALGKLLADIADRHHISPRDIVPHRKNDATACYGANLSDTWAACKMLEYKIAGLQSLLNAMLAAGAP